MASSPDLSSVAYSTQSSTTSVSSSICLDPSDQDDSLFLPVYDFGVAALSPPPSPLSEPLRPTEEDESTECPSRQSTPELPDPETLFVRPNAADDTFLTHEPSRHVDYLSHEWREEDIWASWRYMVGKRKTHTNSARLENASWRTWAKKKNGLKTLSANKLNWLKDCDVTWLYGPLSVGAETITSHSPASPVASPAEPKQSSGSLYKTKPILKKRSMSEIMLQKSLSTSSLLKQATAAIESQQSNSLYPPKTPGVVAQTDSNFGSYRNSKYNSVLNTNDLPSAVSTGCQSPSPKKHIHFNDQVQQCIAVETDDENDDFDDYMYGRRYDADDSSSDDCITMAKSRGNSKCNDKGTPNEPLTIAHLPSTTLKYKDEQPKKSGGSFLSLNSLFSTYKAVSAPSPAPATTKTFSGVKSYVLEDDDDDMAGLDWEPSSSGFSSRRDSNATIRPTFGGSTSSANNSDVDDYELPNFGSWDDDDATEAGLFGRAVDAVNTARDIAHVLWNVGWRR